MATPEHPSISEKCTTCPVLKQCEQKLASDRKFERMITESYKNGVQDAYVDAILKTSETDPDYTGKTALDRDELTEEFLIEQGRLLTAAENRMATIRLKMALLQLGCAGLVRLQAVRRDTEYTLDVCGSPSQEMGEAAVEEVVWVRRRFID